MKKLLILIAVLNVAIFANALRPHISGKISNLEGQTLENVSFILQSNGVDVPFTVCTPIDSEDDYAICIDQLPALPANLELKLLKEGASLNGVSTLDIVLVQKHILNITSLDDYLLQVAADVTGSSTVTALDIVHLRRLILGRDTSFEFVPDWKLFDVDNLSEESIIDAELLPVKVDFVGVKMGDVNNTHIGLQEEEQIEDRGSQLVFRTEDQILQAGSIIQVPITSDNFDDIFSMQGTFRWELEDLEFLGLEGGDLVNFDDHSTGQIHAVHGSLPFSWFSTNGWGVDMQADETLFTLEFLVKSNGYLSNSLILINGITPIEVIQTINFDEIGAVLVWSEVSGLQKEVFDILNVIPTPYTEFVDIVFESYVDGDIRFGLRTLDGQLIERRNQFMKAGEHRIRVSNNETPQVGVYFYEIQLADKTKTGKIIKIE